MMSSASQYSEEMKPLSGGVSVAITRMNGADVIHGAVLGDVLCRSLEEEAKAHNAFFNEHGFENVLSLVKARKIQVHFMVVSLKNSLPKFAGCTVQFPTVLTEWKDGSFRYYPAVYVEDFFVSSEISSAFREQTKSQENPNGLGLGTYFERERIKIVANNLYGDLPAGNAAAGLVVECGAKNRAAASLLKKFGAKIKDKPENAVLQFNNSTNFFEQLVFPVQKGNLLLSGRDGKFENQTNLFVVSWSGNSGKQQITASFTEAVSTFTGSPIVRVQITSNGKIASKHEAERAIKSIFAVGQNEVFKRGWVLKAVSPEEVVPFMRIHAAREPIVTSALYKLGGSKRLLGSCQMMPAILKFEEMPLYGFGACLPTSLPFEVLTRPVGTEEQPSIAIRTLGMRSSVAQVSL